MTQAEWKACTDPDVMLRFLLAGARLSDRKLRLFGCACCRRVWHLLADDRSRRAVEVAEHFADGAVSAAEAVAVGDTAAEVAGDVRGVPEHLGWRAARAAEYLLPPPGESWLLRTAWEYVAVALEGEQLIHAGATPAVLEAWSDQSVESGRTMGWTATNPDAALADVLREVVGDPFRPPALDLAWLTRAVMDLSRAAYVRRDFTRMPELTDALEEAGCRDPDVLGHCRGPGPHTRGCWVVDLLLAQA